MMVKWRRFKRRDPFIEAYQFRGMTVPPPPGVTLASFDKELVPAVLTPNGAVRVFKGDWIVREPRKWYTVVPRHQFVKLVKPVLDDATREAVSAPSNSS